MKPPRFPDSEARREHGPLSPPAAQFIALSAKTVVLFRNFQKEEIVKISPFGDLQVRHTARPVRIAATGRPAKFAQRTVLTLQVNKRAEGARGPTADSHHQPLDVSAVCGR